MYSKGKFIPVSKIEIGMKLRVNNISEDTPLVNEKTPIGTIVTVQSIRKCAQYCRCAVCPERILEIMSDVTSRTTYSCYVELCTLNGEKVISDSKYKELSPKERQEVSI
jgi:hypothetical protein